METVVCALCGGQQITVVATKGIMQKLGRPVDVTNVMCNRCGLVFMNPRPSEQEYSAIYQQYGEQRHALNSKEAIIAYLRSIEKKSKSNDVAEFLRPYVSAGGRAVDIGAGQGMLVKALRDKLGLDIQGVEPGILLSTTVQEYLGVLMFTGTLDDFLKTNPGENFSLIVLHHVLEHFADPVARLRALRGLLQPGGVVYIEVPNVLDFKKPVYQFFDLLHPFSYSPTTLAGMLKQGGFKIIGWNETKHWRTQIIVTSSADPRMEIIASVFKEPHPEKITKQFLLKRKLIDLVTAPFRLLKQAKYD